MFRRSVGLLLLLLLPVPLTRSAEDKWIDLFDGKSLNGWVVEGARTFKDNGKIKDVWIAREGMLSCVVSNNSYGFLRYRNQAFADFHLSVEYRFAPPAGEKGRRGNSGIALRTVPFDPKNADKTRPSSIAYEVQLLDDAGRPANKHSTGSLYGHVAPSAQAARPAPQWNSIEIECVGPRIRITLNGKKIIDVDQTTLKGIKDKPLKGYISLQNHGSPIDFRNIRIRDISTRK